MYICIYTHICLALVAGSATQVSRTVFSCPNYTERSGELLFLSRIIHRKIWRITFSCPKLHRKIWRITFSCQELHRKIWRITFSCQQLHKDLEKTLSCQEKYSVSRSCLSRSTKLPLNCLSTGPKLPPNCSSAALKTSTGLGRAQRKFRGSFLETSSLMRGVAEEQKSPQSCRIRQNVVL